MSSPYRKAWPLAPLALLLVGAVALGGCGDARKALGWDKSPPDEFRVVSRAPLSLPPDYTLRPPTPGAARPQEQSTDERARRAILANTGTQPAAIAVAPTASAGEGALLARVGATTSNPRIREIVNQEAVAQAEAERTLLDRITFWREPEQPGTVVDPERESQRLRENIATGRPVTDGETPTIRRRKRGMLEGIF